MALLKPLGKGLIIYLCFHNKGYEKKKERLPAHSTTVHMLNRIPNCSKFCILSIMDDKDTVCDTHLYLYRFANLPQDQTFSSMVVFTYINWPDNIPTLVLKPL